MTEQSHGVAGGADDLEQHSKKDLVERALAAGVPDVLSKSRAELIEALRGT
ncbi:MAG: hypothetical protein ACI379_11335 [Nocardioides sp.]|uniref:hypothetical protein n=1 Tax=Nocardioides sp. TaxID=35761 RepID=UPI003F021D53